MLGDDIVDNRIPCLRQLIDCYEKHRGSILGVQPVKKSAVSKYGIVDGTKIGDKIYRVKSLVEKPDAKEAPSNMAILGRYITTPKIFEILERTIPDKNGEIQLTDALRALAKIEPMYAYNFKGRRYDAGDKLGFLEANIYYALKRQDLREDLIDYLKDIEEKDI